MTPKYFIMANTTSLKKSNPLTPAEDYESMRSKGFELIEQLGHDLWTDYNNSDPGITILEAVAYAITDLAYRTGFEVKDLLAPKNLTEDTWKAIFYTARKILHCNPLTIADYRKLIIDIQGVRNAWLEPSKEYEVPVWVDYNYYRVTEEIDCDCPEPERIFCMGKLGLQAAEQEAVQSFLAEKKEEVKKKSDETEREITDLKTEIVAIEGKIQNEKDPVALEELNKSRDRLNKQLDWKNKKLEELKKEDEFIAQIKFTPSKIVEFEGLYNVIVEYEEDIVDENKKEEVRQRVVQRLLRHRNLCEDFLNVNTVEYENFGIGASVSLEEYADPDVVLAQIFFTIYKYFTPSVPFYTIQQMQDKGYAIDEIFEGPALHHGFIDTAELEKTNIFRDIRLSDIINEIMDINGIKAITYLHLPFDGFGGSGSNLFFNEWVYSLQNEKKVARIQPSMSQVIFCKEREVVTYYTGTGKDRKPNRMLKLFSDLKIAERKYKLQHIPLDLPVPEGENMELEGYYPVTYSLPMTYGVSERAGLPSSADEKRKMQALQLKGYMLFFEQLLYDYLLQLSHLSDLYTMNETPEHTYFSSALDELQYLQTLLVDDGTGGTTSDDVLKNFSSFLQDLIEPKSKFLQRRNIFLNHFLARFGEDLSSYEAITRLIYTGDVEQKQVTDKVNILKDGEYRKISSGRGRGYNYADQEFWDTENISGAERRISRLLGFNDVKRRYLVPEFITVEPVMILDKKKQPVQKTNAGGKPLNVIKITDPQNQDTILLTSVEVKEGCCTEQLMNDIIANADVMANVYIQDNLNRRARKTAGAIGIFWFEVYDGPDPQTAVLLAESNHYDKKEDRDKALETLENTMKSINDNEGLHLVEHILLRPRLDEVLDEANQEVVVSFPDICLDACDIGIGLNEGEVPRFKKRISRIPAEKCYDKMPWILEYLDQDNHSLLFQSVIVKEDLTTSQVMLKFRRYNDLSQRIEDLVEYGSIETNYTIVSNGAENATDLKFSFIIHNEKGDVLAQSLFVYNKRTQKQIKDGTAVEYDIDEEITAWVEWFGTEMDWYCQANACDNNEDPFSFRTTVVLPCWPKRFRDATFKNLVENTIDAETPAHVHAKVIWLGMAEMKRFEEAYYNWLQELSVTEIPAYEKTNPVVDVLNTLLPCGTCKDECKGDAQENEKDTNNPT